MKTYALLFVAALFLAAFPLATAHASAFEFGKSVAIPKTEVEAQNLYLAGGQITVSTTVQKDIVAGGGTVIVDGPVYGDALLVGGNVTILNDVRGDIRAVGGQVSISGLVSGDVLAGGGTLTIEPGAVVAGDVIVAGGTVDIEGTVNGQVHAYGGDVMINGTIAGPLSIKAGKSVSFGDKAVLGGSVSYMAPAEATVAPGAKIGDQVSFSKSPGYDTDFRGGIKGILFAFFGFLVLVKFIGTLIAALAMVLIFRTFTQTLAERTLMHFWKKVGIGFIALVVAPVAALILVITLVGLYVALFVGIVYALALLIAGVYMGILSGALLSHWIKKETIADWKWTILGTLAVFLLAFVPLVGWIIDAILFLASLGAVVMSIKRDAEEKM